MKKLILAIVTVLVTLSSSVYANGIPEKSNAKENKQAATLTLEELALETELNEEFEISIDEVVESVLTENIETVKVYNVAGELLQEQNLETGIDFNNLPEGAELLMTSGAEQYYIVMQ